MNRIGKGLMYLGLGILALILSSYTRTFKAEYVQFSTLVVFFLFCGWYLRRSCNKILPYPFLFILPTMAILAVGFIINQKGFVHFVGETIMIIPSFFVGFYFLQWPKKVQFATAILLSAFYVIYITKINPELYYNKNTISYKGIKTAPSKSISNFQFTNPDNSILKLDDYKGKVIMLDFYFNNCSPCRKKLPDLVRLKKHYIENKDFVLLAVHRGGSESFSDFLSILKDFPKELNYLYDSSSMAEKYLGINGYPFEILIDKSGHIREQFEGYTDDVSLIYEQKTIKKIDALLNENN